MDHKPKLSPHQQVVLDALQQGKTLTNVVAITCYGVGSLSSRIAELRRMGFAIVDEPATDRFERRYHKYRIEPAAPE